MDITAIVNNRYNTNLLVNNPIKDTKIELIYESYSNNQTSIDLSIVVPIYNQEAIIYNNLVSILEHTKDTDYEIIIILDSCSDSSESIVLDIFKKELTTKYIFLKHIVILKSYITLFETAADNVGFICSQGQYILEIQADIEMTESGYNKKLLIPFLKNNRIIGISGRCCHSFKWEQELIAIGKVGYNYDKCVANIKGIDTNHYYIYETCNRGPLMFDKSKLSKLGYLDEKTTI